MPGIASYGRPQLLGHRARRSAPAASLRRDSDRRRRVSPAPGNAPSAATGRCSSRSEKTCASYSRGHARIQSPAARSCRSVARAISSYASGTHRLKRRAELLREIHRILVALGTPRRARGERLLVGLLQVAHRMALARINRRIEQHQRVETRAVLERMHRGRDARQRMEQSGGRLRAELAIDRVPDHVHVRRRSFATCALRRHAAGCGRDCGSRRRSLRSARAAVPRMESSRRSRGRCRD